MAIYKCTYSYANTILTELSKVCKDYYGQNISAENLDNAVLGLIRWTTYSGAKWNISAGPVDAVLRAHVQNNFPHLFSIINSSIIITDNKNNQIDFTHFCATLDAHLHNGPIPKEWSGWQGDLASLVLEVVKKSNNSKDFDILNSYANTLLGASDSSFSKPDINADIDASNIYNYMKANKLSFLTAFKNYYYNSMNLSRFDRFIIYMGEDDAFYKMLEGPSPNIYLGLVDYGYPGLGQTPTLIQKKAVYGTFANFIFINRYKSVI